MAVLGMQAFSLLNSPPQGILLRSSSSSLASSSSSGSGSSSVSSCCAIPTFFGLRGDVKMKVALAPVGQSVSRQCVGARVVSEIVEEHEDRDGAVSGAVSRRAVLAATTAVSVGSLLGVGSDWNGAALADDTISDWEQVLLPVDPGVVLLDLAFVPDQPDHGFLLGTRQTLLETKDGGRSWNPRSIPSAEDEDFNYRFNSISFEGTEGWIIGKPAILLHTTNGGDSWERIPLSSRLPGNPVAIKATGSKSAEMVTDEGAIYLTSNNGYNWKAAVEETVSATLNRTVSSGISGASYYTGTFNTVNRSPSGDYVAVSSRGNFFLTWEPGQPFWQPHNRTSARRIQNMGWRADGGLWLVVRGGGLYLSKGTGVTEDFEEAKISSRGFGILDIGYRSKEEAWAAGGSGILLRTKDGGKTWVRDRVADRIAANLYSVKFIDEKGFVLGNDGVLLRYLG